MSGLDDFEYLVSFEYLQSLIMRHALGAEPDAMQRFIDAALLTAEAMMQ